MDFSTWHVILELQFKKAGQNVLMYIQICALKKHSIERVCKSLIVGKVKEKKNFSLHFLH